MDAGVDVRGRDRRDVAWYVDRRGWWGPLNVDAEAGMRIFVTGAGGQLGHGTGRRCARRRTTRWSASISRRSTSPTATRCSARHAVATRPVVHGAAFTAVDLCEKRTRAGVHGQLRRHPPRRRRRPTRGATSSTCRPTTSSTARRPGRTSSGTTPDPRRCTAGPSSAASSRSTRLDDRPHLVGVRRSTATTSSRRCCGSAAERELSLRRRPVGASDLRLGPGADGAAARIERVPGMFHATNQGAVSWYEFAPRGLRRRRTSTPRGPAHRHGRAGAAPARAASGATRCSTTLAWRARRLRACPTSASRCQRLMARDSGRDCPADRSSARPPELGGIVVPGHAILLVRRSGDN